MALDINTETVSCDGEQCDNTAPIANSVIKGWWFTVCTAHTINHYVDFCPDCSGRKTINITPPEPEQK